MSRIPRHRRPSPALVVSVLALCAALVGTAVAVPVTISLNKREKKQVKRIAKKVSKRQANKRITRRAPNLAVKSAETADSANTANTADSANTATAATTAGSAASAASADTFGGMTPTRIEPFTLANGGSQQVGVFGPFTLTATCAINVGGFDFAQISATTSQNNSAFLGEKEDADFDIGETVIYVGDDAGSPTGDPFIDEDGALAIAPDGTELLGHQLYTGVNILGDGANCRYGGVVFVG